MADWSANRRRNSPGLWTETQIFAERMGQEMPIFGDPTQTLHQTQNGTMLVSDPKLNEEIRDYLKRQTEIMEQDSARLRGAHATRMDPRQE